MTRRPGQGPLSNYRSEDTSGRVWWKRNADPVGWHSILAFALAIGLVAVVGVTLDPLGVTTEFDLPEKQQAAFDESYAAARQTALETWTERGRREALIAEAVGAAATRSPWVRGARAGWSEGWNDALDALKEASEAHAPREELDRELSLLEGIPRR